MEIRRELLNKYLQGLDGILIKFKKLLKEFDNKLLLEIANDFINLGNSLYYQFGVISHRILCITALEAGLRLKEKVKELEKRNVTNHDIEYLQEVYNIFKYIADKIESGEYEEELLKMEKNKDS